MTEGSIADRFGVSRTPAREALQRLQSDGLMRGYVRGGWEVVPIDFKRFADLYEMRKLIETFRYGTNAIAQETAQHVPNVVRESAYQSAYRLKVSLKLPRPVPARRLQRAMITARVSAL
ncbi:DNA-binding GntR family transcriptional regulator [Paraburkholderia sp. WSM4177]|nr:DNA-binding GntR family transcriptional regulator [Paraburkholderia sp. WSM4177]MBB5488559.1 DNA-binding GntR family transcriptional regulator [Paraburkholderia sp. WSM4180]